MTKFKFFPEDFSLDAKLLKWTTEQGLSEKQIADQLDRIKDHEFQPMRSCPTRTWRRWIRNAIKWEHVVPSLTKEYRKPEKLSKEQREQDKQKFNDQMSKWGIKT